MSTGPKHPEIRNRYLSIKKRRGHKKAIVAIARMLLAAIYHILKDGVPFNPGLYRRTDSNPFDSELQAILLLEKRGFTVAPPAPLDVTLLFLAAI